MRFGGKAELLGRVVDEAVVGDAEPVDLLGRSWMQTALTAPTAPSGWSRTPRRAGRSSNGPGRCSRWRSRPRPSSR
ncbi:hypothetical protein I4I84_29880 [Pseudonocardia sp. KRD-182]|nr:hypothetical protein [Pseudonocardia oceani]